MIENKFGKEFFLVLTTELNKAKAFKISSHLLKKKLIACVNFINLDSHFWWDGKITKSKEVQLIMKCTKENVDDVCTNILKVHSYKTPEIVYFPVKTNKLYYNWLSSL